MLTRRRDGVIGAYDPLMVNVSDTLPDEGEQVEFFLYPENGGRPIPVTNVCIHDSRKVIVLLPYLLPGRYRPAIAVRKEGEATRLISHGDEVWTVEEDMI